MNANELADALDDVVANYIQMIADVDFSDVATMLRQQQAELDRAVELYTDKAIENEALKQIIDANNLNQNIGQFVKPINEPVAWMDDLSFFTEQPDDMDGVTPLYTHPVKKLTDEDRSMLIRTLKWSEDLLREAGHDEAVSDAQDCLMILRKAQEK